MTKCRRRLRNEQIVKCWSGCEGSGDIVETIHTIEDDDDEDDDESEVAK